MNETLSELFSQMAFLLELKEENPFKIKAFQNVARVLEELPEAAAALDAKKELEKTKGIGKGSLGILREYFQHEKVKEFEALKVEFPDTIFELLQVRGLGPKKAKALYKELGISCISELEYACNENRLLDVKGFGKKTQDSLLASIEEIKGRAGKTLLARALEETQILKSQLEDLPKIIGAQIVGETRRMLPVVARYDFLVDAPEAANAAINKFIAKVQADFSCEIHVEVHSKPSACTLFRANSSAEFLREIGFSAKEKDCAKAESEEEIFKLLKEPYLPPECRESQVWKKTSSGDLITESDLRGVFHSHTTWSDGSNSLEEMVLACKDLGFSYLGISDHSQSAGYAHGLDSKRIKEQRKEIDELHQKYSDFTIFHGIESDILNDGSLDYPESVLREFDFVIASIHQNFRMEREAMTKRLCRALENPHTTWLGHLTGRLLLGRNSYHFDMEKVLQTAGKLGKGIEHNSNPYRLDLDWTHLAHARDLGISIGIFPDAHSTHGLKDTRFGIAMARKAGLRAKDIVNTLPREKMKAWLAERK